MHAFDFIVASAEQLLPPVLFVYVPHLCAEEDQIAARAHTV